MISAVIIDDEQNNIDNLEALLCRHCPGVKVLASANDAIEGEDIIRRYNPELIFLDIQMPGKNGFELLKGLQNFPFSVIFVTAFDQYGIQAVKFSAIDYLLKPVNVEELKAAVNKVEEMNQRKNQNLKLENLIEVLKQEQQKASHRIALQSAKETRFIETGRITRCESSNNYTTFYLDSGEKLLTSKPIFEYEELLSAYGFFRCHQSHLVNTKKIRSWVKEEGGYLVMEDSTQVPVSRNKKEALRGLLEK